MADAGLVDGLDAMIGTHNNPDYKPDDLLAFYMATGGVAKYIEQLVQFQALTKTRILDAIFKENSYFLNEGKDVLIDEFGKDYGNYFSILSLIASSKTERGEMESILEMPVGGYLDKLEKEYNIIKRVRPFGAKEGSRNNKYLIEDNFLNLWFRFIYKYRSAIEIGNLDYVRNIMDSMEYSDIQGYWNNKGEDEIDIVAVNEFEKRIVFCEIKRNPKRISLPILEEKSKNIVKKFSKFTVEYKGLSLEDM